MSGILDPPKTPGLSPLPAFSKPCQPSEGCFPHLDTEGRIGKRENGEGLKASVKRLLVAMADG